MLVAVASALVVSACGSSDDDKGSASASTTPASTTAAASSKPDAPMRLGIATWIGYAPLVVADKQGYFKDEGLDFKYTVIDDGAQRFNALKAGQIDGVATTVDAFARINAEGIASKQVLGFDHSVGGDGILAAAGTTAADLKGKKIGVPTATTSQFFLGKYLEDNGMSLKDVDEVNLTAGDAGSAFLAGRIPNAVTYEPYLTKARQKDGAEVLVDSTKYPDLIVDTLGLAPSYVTDHPASVNAFLRAYFRAVADLQDKPDSVYPLLEDYLGLKPAEMAATFKTVKIYDQQESKTFMKEQLPQVYDEAGQFWVQQGEIKTPQPAAQAIDASFIDGLG
jgi:NitT/TauT family transport system substrate-binding protein